jgi:hypothetical protein
LAEKLDPPTESLENQKTKNAERPPKWISPLWNSGTHLTVVS